MAEVTQISFKHTEVAELLIKKQGLHEGIWGLFFKFGLGASNIGPTETEITPSAIVGVLEIGLQKFEKESSIAVDAGKVNPPRVAEIATKQDR
jgi:hypothetical protein